MKRVSSKVDVVICVHNALEDVKKCIESVKQTDYPKTKFSIILVDDGSEKPTRDYLKSIAKQDPKIKLIRRENAGGYTVAANTGMKASEATYCALLNSDTIVPKKWLKKIVDVFVLYPDLGIVGPLSNAASWQSVPDISAPTGGWAVNEIPEGWNIDDMDACVEKCHNPIAIFPRVPLLNGFCYVLSKDLKSKIGFLDEVGFPKGFGEEDDYCMRASNAGFGIMVATNTYVYHAKSKSYGSARRKELAKKGAVVLRNKHSEVRIQRSVATMKDNPFFLEMRHAISNAINGSE